MPNYPFLISFSGIDGSGKTQHIILLRRFLRRQGVPYLYLHSVKDSFANRFLVKFPLLGKYVEKNSNGENENLTNGDGESKVKRKRPSKLSIAIRVFILFLDGVFLRYRLFRSRKDYSVVILDRYVYDKLINLAYLRNKLDLSCCEWLIRVFPRPNIPLYLHVDPQDAIIRKGETAQGEGQDEKYFEKKYRLFEEAKFRWKLITIDTSSLSISEGKKKILSHFKKRFYRFLKS